jgi:hypothetical protein
MVLGISSFPPWCAGLWQKDTTGAAFPTVCTFTEPWRIFQIKESDPYTFIPCNSSLFRIFSKAVFFLHQNLWQTRRKPSKSYSFAIFGQKMKKVCLFCGQMLL